MTGGQTWRGWGDGGLVCLCVQDTVIAVSYNMHTRHVPMFYNLHTEARLAKCEAESKLKDISGLAGLAI